MFQSWIRSIGSAFAYSSSYTFQLLSSLMLNMFMLHCIVEEDLAGCVWQEKRLEDFQIT